MSTARTNLDQLWPVAFEAFDMGVDAYDKTGALFTRRAPAVVVGAGGSHPAADYIARLLRADDITARACVPHDAAGPDDQLIAVSYSGTTPDIEIAVERHRRRNPAAAVTIITGDANRPRHELYDNVHGHRHPQRARERGFIAVGATVAPAAYTLGAYTRKRGVAHTVRNTLERYANRTAPHDTALNATNVDDVHVDDMTVDVFGTGWAMPAVADIESTWIEAGLGRVVVHESKNFSHGRYQTRNTHPCNITVHVTVGRPDPYETALRDLLERRSSTFVPLDVTCDPVHDDVNGPVDGLCALITAQHFEIRFGELHGVDISRPEHIDPDGVVLHNWTWTS